jgi:hypothetical protein
MDPRTTKYYLCDRRATSAAQLQQSLRATELTLDSEEMEVRTEICFRLPRLSDPMVATR